MLRLHQMSHLRLRESGDSINGRDDASEAEVQLRGSDRGVGVFDLAVGRLSRSFRSSDLSIGCTKLCTRCFNSGCCSFDLRLRNYVRLHCIVVLLLRHCFFFDQRRVLVDIELGLDLVGLGLRQLSLSLQELTVRLRNLRLCLDDLRLCLCELTFKLRDLTVGLIQSRLKWTRIDFKQELAFLHERAFFVILSQ